MARPTFAFHLSEEGVVRVVRTDGAPITEEELEFLRDNTREGLRVAALAKSVTHVKSYAEAELPRGTEGKTRGGVRFDIDPLIHELDAIRERRKLSATAVAKAMFTQRQYMYDWVRGKSRPHLETVRTWAAALGRMLMIVPLDLVPKVREMIAEWENNNETADEEAA